MNRVVCACLAAAGLACVRAQRHSPSHYTRPPSTGISAGCAGLPDGSGFNVTWSAVEGAVLYEVQVAAASSGGASGAGGGGREGGGGGGRGGGAPATAAFAAWQLSVTSGVPAVQIVDLEPATTYALKVRSTNFNEVSGWTDWQQPFDCRTAAAPAAADGAARSSFAGAPAAGPADADAASRIAPPAVRARQPSCEGCQFLSVVRVSERNNTEPDFLSNHDCGDPEGDSLFLTATGGGGGKFIPEWNISAITQ
jgi:hypothetical protein